MKTTETNSKEDFLQQFNVLIKNLSPLVLGQSHRARDMIRELWRTRRLNSAATMRQRHQGFEWFRSVLGESFRKDGNYEKAITDLVISLGGWPNEEGKILELDYYEQQVTQTGGNLFL